MCGEKEVGRLSVSRESVSGCVGNQWRGESIALLMFTWRLWAILMGALGHMVSAIFPPGVSPFS